PRTEQIAYDRHFVPAYRGEPQRRPAVGLGQARGKLVVEGHRLRNRGKLSRLFKRAHKSPHGLSGDLSRSAHAVLACRQGSHVSDYTLKHPSFGRTIPGWFAQFDPIGRLRTAHAPEARSRV